MTTKNNLGDTFTRARRAGVPLIVIGTPDQFATMATLTQLVGDKIPVIAWDATRGLRSLNKAGATTLSTASGGLKPNELRMSTTNPTSAMEIAEKFADSTLFFMVNLHRFIMDPFVATSICNLRDLFKQNERTLVGLGPMFDLPQELRQDVIVLDEPLPDDEKIGDIIENLCKFNSVKVGKDVLNRATDALRGLSSFAVEQVGAMALRKTGPDIEELWERKKSAISQVKGLTLTTTGPTFSDLGGNQAISAFGQRLFRNEEKSPKAVVRIDEIEKALAGAGTLGAGDSTGVSQDMLGVILQWMEDGGNDGLIAVGPPGSGKSLFSKALGLTFGRPVVAMDLGAMKGSYVGESERAIREACKVIDGIASGRAFIVATCNKLDVLPPELRRRFRSGIWFFDLPTKEERDVIWTLNLTKYSLDASQPRPEDAEWTGAEIRNCCDLAYRLDCTLIDAATFIVPVARADAKGIDTLRTAAEGKFPSASYADTYQRERNSEARRHVSFEDEPQEALVMTAVVPINKKPAATAAEAVKGKTTKGES